MNNFPNTRANDLVWKDEYAVGIDLVDEQHKQLFEIFNRLAVHVFQGRPGQVTLPILVELRKYCISHFSAEERILMEREREGLQEHIALHKAFVDRLNNFMIQIQSGSWESMSLEMLNFIQHWLIYHVMGIDKEQLST